MNPTLLRWLPLPILVVGGLGAWGLAVGRTPPEVAAPRATPPRVEVVELARRDVQTSVRTHGSVEARTEIDLVAEVEGRVESLAPELAVGAFFDAGDVLVELDARDARLALERAEAAAVRMQSEVGLAQARLDRLRALATREISSAAQLEEAQHAQQSARARLREARAVRDQARLDLERTRITAPFDGRVRAKHVDVGQFAARGAPLARIQAVDYAEVRLPIPSAELAFLELPAGGAVSGGPPVILRADFAGQPASWSGRIVRAEGEIAARTRMLHVVARVKDPYGRRERRGRSPLAVGQFVEAEILGRTLEDVFVLPRAALRGRSEVLVVGADERLRARRVEVLRVDGDRFLVGAGLEAGERVCVEALSAVEGLEVRAARVDPPVFQSLAGLRP